MPDLKTDIAAAVDAGLIAGDATDRDVLAWYEAGVTADRSQTSGDVWSLLAKQSDFSFAGLRNAAHDPDNPAQELALRAWSLLSDRGKVIDFTDGTEAQAFTAALDQLVSAGFMTAGHKAALLAIFREDVPRWQARGVGRVTERDIHAARTV